MVTRIQVVANGIIVALYATAYVVALKCHPDVKRQRLEDIRKVSARISWVPATVLCVLAWASYPLGVVLDYSIRGCKGACKDRERRTRIDTWIVLCASLELVVLLFVKTLPALFIFPLTRLFDLLHTLFRLLLFRKEEASKARSLVLLLIHFVEVVVIFACGYVALQALDPQNKLFCINNTTKDLNQLTAVYFSFVTASTLGYGDVTVVNCCDGVRACSIVVVAHAAIFFEILSVIFITALSIPRALSIHEEIDLSE